jgi:aspartate/methionine/tyrosine aminotransferase
LARKNNVALIIDETYRDFIVPGPPHDLFLSIPPSSSSLYSAPTSSLSHHTPTNWDWRSTLIHLYSFSKAYHIPGHRLGALVASPSFQREAFKVLDCLQICANRSAQRAFSTPGLLHSLRPFVQQGTAALASRQKVFKASLPPPWKIGAQGAYYAFVRHPFTRRSAEEICERLASEAGVVTLPVVYFAAGVDVAGMEVGWERWIRVSVANVEEEVIREVCVRMGKVVDEWAWEVDVGA